MANHPSLKPHVLAALPLTPAVFNVLLALADGPRHGYAISKEADARTNGAVRLGPGTLYGTLNRLVALGWVAETSGPGDDRRRFYRLTPAGREVAGAEAQRLADLVLIARDRALLPRKS